MRYKRIEAVIRVVGYFEKWEKYSDGVGLGNIAEWANIPRASCDRLLKQMTLCDFLVETWVDYRGGKARRWKLSAQTRRQVERGLWD